jgi:chromatin structure-remodeling complex protein RSC7
MLRRLPLLVKVQMTPAEKEQAVEAGRVSNSLKFRSVTMIPIRNVYKYLGAKIVKGESFASASNAC